MQENDQQEGKSLSKGEKKEKHAIAVEKWEEKIKKRVEKNQDWFFPIISAIALGGMGFIDSFSKDKTQIIVSLSIRHLGIIGIILFSLSILCILFHLYLDMKWSTMYLEGEISDTKKINNLRKLLDFSFWILIIAIFISIILYSYVQFK